MMVFNPLGTKVYYSIWGPWDVLTCPDIGTFSVAYKHINGTGEITSALYLAQTGLP